MGQGRVPTGIEGLDMLIGGGFPRGSLIIIAGNPGVGKTIFAAEFLYHGATQYRENGMYVSSGESPETLNENMLSFGFDFSKLEKEGRIRFVDMTTAKEDDLDSILTMIYNGVVSSGSKRLVIDSFSALALSIEKTIDTKALLQTLFGRIVRLAGCTTLLITDIPIGEERIGVSVEEFVADGLLLLRRYRINDSFVRALEIAKIRGTKHSEKLCLYEIGPSGMRFFPEEHVFKLKE